MSTQLYPQSISSSGKDIVSLSTDLINKEKGKVCRILYAGPNFSSSGLVVYRFVELSRNQNYVEKLTFDRSTKTATSSLFYLQMFSTDRIKDSFRQFKEDKGLKTINSITTNTLYRTSDDGTGHIRSNVIYDDRQNMTFFLSDFYMYWKLRSWARK